MRKYGTFENLLFTIISLDLQILADTAYNMSNMTQSRPEKAILELASSSLENHLFGVDTKLLLPLWFVKTFP